PASSEITREEDPLPVCADVEERAAEDVAGLVDRDLAAVHHLYGDVVAEPFEAARRGFRCGGGVEGESRTVLAIPTPVRVTRFLFLQVSAVGKEQPGQVARPFGAQRAPHETLRAQPREEARVIDVRVREDHRVELAAGPGRPVPQPQLLSPLEEAGVDQDPVARRCGEEMTRTGDGLGGAEEGERGHRGTVPYRPPRCFAIVSAHARRAPKDRPPRFEKGDTERNGSAVKLLESELGTGMLLVQCIEFVG